MSKQQIKQIVEARTGGHGMVDTGVKGVQFFRYSEPMNCAPAVIEPCVVAILGGVKEAIFDGRSHLYDNSRYMCCPFSMPVEAGMREASPDNPLLGVYIALDARIMTELAIEMERNTGAIRKPDGGSVPQGFALAHWDDAFTEALLRLVQLETPADAAVLGEGRLREVCYAVLKGAAGRSARRAYGVGNEVARSIAYLSERLNEPVTIEDMAAQVGMSRAVFHRKFKQATTLSPIQFAKSMRLNNAAMKIAGGMSVNEAAMDVGYVSASQFSREFKRMYGQSPRQWSHTHQVFTGVA
jgi:AraC-like DNA-binding protein